MIAALELLSLQGVILRRQLMRFFMALAVLLLGFVAGAVGLVFLVWSCFLALSALIGAPLAALLSGLVFLALCMVLFWTAKLIVR